ncbi:MAG: hypothetical protein EP332_10515 [Bacteroidetes bacterium]|nr:MAG: hypothetical protein EP332_10515 [Bacteroidota bacterium]
MKKVLYTGLMFGAAIGLLTFSACEKAISDVTETTVSGEDAVIVESAIASAFDVVDDIASTDGRMQKNGTTLLPDGVDVVFTDSLFTDNDGVEFYVDFGAYDPSKTMNGVLCADGKYRAGKITITANKPYTELGCVIEAKFEDGADAYYIGDGLTMIKVLANLKATRTGQETATLEITGCKVFTPEGTVEFQSNKQIKRIKGNDQPGSLGDEYEVTGNGSGTNRNGEPFTIEITKTLLQRIEDGCSRTFIVGIIELKNTSSNKSMSVDFDPKGDGACDRLIRITLPGGINKDIIIGE